jgi:methylamine utilization protein MauJ
VPQSPKNPSPQNRSVQLDPMRLPGFQQHILARPQYRDPNDPRNLGGPAGLPGQYKAVFTLSRPGFSLLPENQHSFADQLQGDSHLAITKPAHTEPNNPDADRIRIYARTADANFVFTGYPNPKGFLAKIELDSFYASHFGDAALKAYRALASGLSNICVYLDIPLHIYQMDITELRTNSVRMSLLAAHAEIPLFMIPTDVVTEEFRRYASLYREALNSNSPNYQFLCYYKIIEGIRKRQERLIAEAKARGETITTRPRLIIPTETEEQIKWLNSIFPVPQTWDSTVLQLIFPAKSLGRKVNDMIQGELEPIRNRIAHTVLRSGEPTISIDEGLDMDLVTEWLPFGKCIARLLIKTEFPYVFNT